MIRLGIAGELTMKQIAHAEGISIETVRCYFKSYREGGTKALLHRDYKDKDKTRTRPAASLRRPKSRCSKASKKDAGAPPKPCGTG